MTLQTILQTWFRGDINRFNKILQRYLESNRLNREQLKQAFLANDSEALAQIIHKMRGSAAQMRMDQYATVLLLLESNLLSCETLAADLMQQEEAEWQVLSNTSENWLEQHSSQDEHSDTRQSSARLD